MGTEEGAQLSEVFGAGCPKPPKPNQGGFIAGLCRAERSILLCGEGAENDTVGKSLLGNLTQEQHKCGICLWPWAVGAAQGNAAGSQDLSPLQYRFPSADQAPNLLKARDTGLC